MPQTVINLTLKSEEGKQTTTLIEREEMCLKFAGSSFTSTV